MQRSCQMEKQNIQWQWQIDQERRRQEQQQTDRDRNRQSAREHLDQLTNQANDLQQQKREVEIDQQKIAATVRKTEIEIESAMNERTRQLGLIERRMSPVAERLRIEQQIKLLEQSLLSARELETLRTLQSSELDLQLAAVGKRLSEAMQGLASMNTDSSTMQATLQSGFNEPPNSHALLEPFVQAIAVQDAKIRILANQIATNEIMAPASGTVTEIHHLPGTFVKSGDPILTIATDQRRWIVAYIDQRDYWDIQPKTPVQIRILGAQTFVTTSAVAERGNHFEDVPVQLRRDARIAQWGVPIKVPVPHGVNVAPGQMVELVIQ